MSNRDDSNIVRVQIDEIGHNPAIRDLYEGSLVEAIGDASTALAEALRDVAYAIRGLPQWQEPAR